VGWLLAAASLLGATAAGCAPGPSGTVAAPAATTARPATSPPQAAATTPLAAATGTPSPDAVAGFAPSGPTEKARVVRIVDGDTIVVDRGRGSEKVRYIGMDTPETVKPGSPVEWMGPEASAANRALVEGRTVVLEKDVSETDRYGRLLRHVWLREKSAWLLVDLELVREGYARVSTYPPDVKYVDLYLAAQVDAREHDRGLWGAGPIDFTSPADGATVTTKTVLVTGKAPAGERVVRDIANAPDQSTRARADGTWGMRVTLKNGVNSLRFRLADEKATTRTLRVVYAP
jgi:micrococcal nuclease